jgi:hypothetical protein
MKYTYLNYEYKFGIFLKTRWQNGKNSENLKENNVNNKNNCQKI